MAFGFILKMNNSKAGRNVRGSSDNSPIGVRCSNLTIQNALTDVQQATDPAESSSKEQFQNVIGQHVSKKFAELMYEGVVKSHDDASKMFKVVYTNGHSEEMRWGDLMKYLVPHKQPVHPYPNELPNRNDETGKDLARIVPAPPTQRRRRTRKMSSETHGEEDGGDLCPPREVSTRGLRRSTRKRKQVYSYCEETADEDEYNDPDEPNYPLPPIYQLPWADEEDENSMEVPTRGLAPQGKGQLAKKHWVSLRMRASGYPSDAHKIASDESEGLED